MKQDSHTRVKFLISCPMTAVLQVAMGTVTEQSPLKKKIQTVSGWARMVGLGTDMPCDYHVNVSNYPLYVSPFPPLSLGRTAGHRRSGASWREMLSNCPASQERRSVTID